MNDKVYIGQTTLTVHERFMAHKKPSTHKRRSTYKLYNAMLKYGVDKFYVETLEENIPLEQLNEKEIWYIDHYDSFNNGYNSTRGGDGRIFNKLNNEEEVLRLAQGGMSAPKIANVFGVNTATVIRTLHKLGFYYRVDQAELVRLADSGLTYAEVAEIMNCDKATVERAYHRVGKRRRRIDTKYRNDICWEELINDYESGISTAILCLKYDISNSALGRELHKRGVDIRRPICDKSPLENQISIFDQCNDYEGSLSRAENELPSEAHRIPLG